ncbi:hypothetical protein [Pseudomonas sp. DSV-1]|jgi:hypothetical protein|uniref:hypothetical protein n=1 Tax=Pseudomonas sp. DSV-1 TaxID=3112250 RepID=UPI002DBAE660|nr:hypothetical protein [Pseudomonas sp. DSV-1]MEC4242442.1 hypothetical protein [Pseudomonas sp. DSV-1]
MSNTNIGEIYESFSEDDANQYLANGWVIVAVVSGVRELAGKEEVGPVYVLGKPAATAGKTFLTKK